MSGSLVFYMNFEVTLFFEVYMKFEVTLLNLCASEKLWSSVQKAWINFCIQRTEFMVVV